jgi:hypothetical protein
LAPGGLAPWKLTSSPSEAELRNWRDALREALSPNGLLMVDLVPELKLVIGEQLPVPELPPQDAQRRFQLVFRRFIGVFARPEHPLALFLDDLQWLDAATLDLVEDLLTRPDVQHLMLIGAYRDNEVNSANPLMRKLEAIRQGGAIVHEIILDALVAFDISYEHMAALGGLRGKTQTSPRDVNGFWTNESFHNYADYALSAQFHAGLNLLLDEGRKRRCVIMCSEAVWWRTAKRFPSP